VSSVHRHVRVTDRSGRRDAAPADTNGKWGLPRHPARIDRGVAHHTLATSNEKVALKQDTDYVTDPTAIGRHVRTKGGLTSSLQVRFGVDTVNPKEIRKVVSTVLAHDPDGSDPDAWVAELALVGREQQRAGQADVQGRLPRVRRLPWTRWRAYWNRRTAAVTPPHRSWWRTASSPKRRRSQMHANSLLSTGSEGALGTVHRYPRSAGGTLPQCDHYLTDGCRRPRRVDPYRQRRQ